MECRKVEGGQKRARVGRKWEKVGGKRLVKPPFAAKTRLGPDNST
jgi:hypothetical protein